MKKEVLIIGILMIIVVISGCTSKAQQSPPKKLDPQVYQDCTTPTDGMIITQNTVFCPGEYLLPNGIVIGANGVSLDCNNATLKQGNPYENEINGISLRGISLSTVKNCNLGDYRQGVYLESATGNKISNIYSNADSVIEGIVLTLSADNLISDNYFIGLGPAFKLDSSPSNTIINNFVRAAAFSGDIKDSDNLIIYDNDLGTASGGGGGGEFSIYTSNFINFSNNSVLSLHIVDLSDSTFVDNAIGRIGISDSHEIEFSENHFVSEFYIGNIPEDSTNIIFKNNNITNIQQLGLGPFLHNVILQNNTIFAMDLMVGVSDLGGYSSSNILFSENQIDLLVFNVGPYTENFTLQDNEIEVGMDFRIDSDTLLQLNRITGGLHGNLDILGQDNEIKDNIISNLPEGIIIEGDNNRLISNLVTDGEMGITLRNSHNNLLQGNNLSSNTYNLLIEGGEEANYIHDIDTTNLVDGKPIYYIVNGTNQIYSSPNIGFFACILCNNVEVMNIDVKNLGDGVLFWGTDNSKIQNAIISENIRGIRMEQSYNNEIFDIVGQFNTEAGIYVANSGRNTIESINANQNGYGIFLNSSDENNIKDTYIMNSNESGIYILDSRINNLSNVTSAMNLRYGIHLESSSENKIINSNPIINTEHGIFLGDSSYNSIIQNTIEYNGYKIGLIGANIFVEGESQYNRIESNSLRDYSINHTAGIIVNSDNNQILNNEIVTNAEGITIGGNNNKIWYNNFVQNVLQASDFGSNSWDDGTLGNYWSDFDEVSEGCNDVNQNNICDSGRFISGGSNTDNFPSNLRFSFWGS